MATAEATFEFIQWQSSYEKQKPYEILIPLSSLAGDASTVPRSNLVFEPRSLPVRDVRGREDAFDLDTHGFQFVRRATIVEDLKDRVAVKEQYVPEIEDFLRRHLSLGDQPVRTFGFDLRLRESIDINDFSKRTVNLEDGFDPLLPATHPHIDQSVQGAISRVRRHMGDEADSLLKGRVRVIKIWRPLSTVHAWPLAVCDAQSVDPVDLVTCDIVRRRYIGETYFGKYSPSQRWYYMSGMDANEGALLKIYDSHPDVSAKRKATCFTMDALDEGKKGRDV